MPGPFPQNFPEPTPEQKTALEAAAKKKRNIAVGSEVSGLTILAVGLALLHIWLGVAAFGLGLILIGIGTELS